MRLRRWVLYAGTIVHQEEVGRFWTQQGGHRAWVRLLAETQPDASFLVRQSW